MPGVILTIAGAVLIAAYILFFRVIKRQRVNAYVHLYGSDQVSGVKAHDSYIDQLTRQIFDCPEKGTVKLPESEEPLSWPDIEEGFMDREKYDFSKRKPKPRTSHITEDDEAYRVLEELDRKKNNDKDDIN